MARTQPLVGRKWEYGRFDCYTLVRDFFAQQGISLPDFERPKDLETCDSIFLEQAQRCGFVRVDYRNKRAGDVLIMRLDTRAPMHGAILLPDDLILHQRENSLSAIEPLGRYYAESVAAVFRYAAEDQAAG